MPSKYGFGNTRKKSPYRMGKPHYGIDQKSPVRDWERFKEGMKGALHGASVNVGDYFPGKKTRTEDRYPGVDMIQGWKWKTSEYDKKKAEARRKKEKRS
jgi:hypothetical protein